MDPLPAATPALDRVLFLDLEIDADGNLREIGAVLGDREWRQSVATTSRNPGSPRRVTAPEQLAAALRALDRFATGAEWLAGHNLLGHDLPHLERHAATLLGGAAPRLLRLPVIDTLLLSPLAFPQRPYHQLVKDYKLQSTARNDPVADARLARELLDDETQVFRALHRDDPDRLALLLGPLRSATPGERVLDGCAGWIAAHSRRAPSDDALVDRAVERHVLRCCTATLRTELATLLRREPERAAAAFALAWLEVADTSSVLPRWVRLRFPAAAALIQAVRELPACDAGGRAPCRWCARMHDPTAQLRERFGWESFQGPAGASGRPVQEEVVRLGLRGEASLAILPTGFGKSVCFQLPALVRHARTGALTVVISPLQALMQDQVANLNDRTNAKFAAALNGMLTPLKRADVLDRVRLGDVALLYVSPEQLRNRSFTETIRAREIAAWVFDEAHCLAKWGHDFRPDYHYSGRFLRDHHQREGTPIAPVHCFTATARRDVRDEILRHFRGLGLELKPIELPPKRSNLTFEVRDVTEARKLAALDEALREHLPPVPAGGAAADHGKAIVYCATRRRTETTALALTRGGLPAAAIHAGLEATAKSALQKSFARGDVRVICATNAFGMGIDEPHVRLVAHLDVPGSLENYLQEAGRAGRDRAPAHCLLLFHEADIDRQHDLLAKSRLTRNDLVQILKSIRRCARRQADGGIVVTAGELLHDDRTDVSFHVMDRDARTKVATAVSWLERGEYLLRDDNRTQVFQGAPKVASLAEGRARIDKLPLAAWQREQWLRLLERLFAADSRESLDMDELARSIGIREFHPAPARIGDPVARTETPTTPPNQDLARKLRQTLRDMVRHGLLDEGLFLTAFVRQQIADGSRERFTRLSALDRAFVAALRAAAPDLEPWIGGGHDDDASGGESGWYPLDLRQLRSRLAEAGDASHPQQLRKLLFALAEDGRRETDAKGQHCASLDLRHRGGDQWRIRLRRGFAELEVLTERRREAAGAVLDAILAKAAAKGRGEVLVEFGASELVDAVQRRLPDASDERAHAAMERALLHLHELEVITLQKGLALFRQAMTLRLVDARSGQQYTAENYRQLHEHYEQRTRQVHVMRKWARTMAMNPATAERLVADYFALENTGFEKRWFADERKELERPVNPPTYERIVTALHHPLQKEIVTARTDQDLLVLAGPGAGKTRVVVHRCAWLLTVERVAPEALLVLCFNRGAAAEVRRRLRDLVGDLARRVAVHTYHALALRLTGRSLEQEREARRVPRAARTATEPAADGTAPAERDATLDALLDEAIELLRGRGAEVADEQAAALRERLLAGYRHLLVDEYQDVDHRQYELIRILAGLDSGAESTTARTPHGGTERRTDRARVLAVGDDDQMIYGWRGADARWLQRFVEDYGAKSVHLVDNHRSSAAIVAAANALIAPAPGRMKADHPIAAYARGPAVAASREWAAVDGIARGRVQRFAVANRAAQLATLVREIGRLRALPAKVDWSEFAVLARRHAELDPVRAWCEANDIPTRRRLTAGQRLPLHRVRECAAAFAELARGDAPATPEELRRRLGLGAEHAAGAGQPWRALVADALDAFAAEMNDEPTPPAEFAAFLHEQLAEEEHDRALGNGLFLGSVHAAKGLEFGHVFVLDGGWCQPRQDEKQDHAEFLVEERRAYYVAATRARLSLHLFRRADARGGFSGELPSDAPWLLDRDGADGRDVPPEILARRYELLGLADLDLGYAGSKPPGDPLHRRLRALATGDRVALRADPAALGARIEIIGGDGYPLARLSKKGVGTWSRQLAMVRDARVVAMVERRANDGEANYHARYRCERWEVPVLELRLDRD